MQSTRLYFVDTSHPPWLTKSIMKYVGGTELVNCIDWLRSGRHCLYVKKNLVLKKLKNYTFITLMVKERNVRRKRRRFLV